MIATLKYLRTVKYLLALLLLLSPVLVSTANSPSDMTEVNGTVFLKIGDKIETGWFACVYVYNSDSLIGSALAGLDGFNGNYTISHNTQRGMCTLRITHRGFHTLEKTFMPPTTIEESWLGSDTLIALQAHPNVITIGSQSAGANGSRSVLPIPGGLYMLFTGMASYYADNGRVQGLGVRLDELVRPN